MNETDAGRLIRSIRPDRPVPQDLSPAQWHNLLQHARRIGVFGLIARRLLTSDLPLSHDSLRTISEELKLEARHHGFFFFEAARLTHEFNKRGLDPVVLKGVGLARTAYEDPVERSFRDLDLFLPEEQLDEARSILEESGYRPVITGAPEEVYREHHFHLIFEGPGCPRLELHWSLTRPGESCALSHEDLRSVEAGAGLGFRVPAPESQLLHCSLNLLRGGFTELKRLVDIDRLVRNFARMDLAEVATAAQRVGLARPLRIALELAHELLETPAGPLLESLAPLGRRRRWLVERLPIERFPLRMAPASWPLAPHLIHALLAPKPVGEMLRIIGRSEFERARLRARGVSRARMAATTLKRAALAALLLSRIAALCLRGHPQPLSLSPAASSSSSPPAVADRAGTRGPAS